MFKKFMKASYLMFHQVKILHSIPGRLRLSVPFLDKVPKEMRKYEAYTTELLLSKTGIQKIDYSYTTSKVLILYDAKLLSDKEIVDYMNRVWKIIVDHSDLYENMSQEEIENNLEDFYAMLKEEIEKGE